MQELKSSLYYKDARSDKEYHAQLVAEGAGFMVYFQYGKRGGTLASGKKTATPVDHAVAKKAYDAVLKEKMGKGYAPGDAGTAYVGTSLEERFTGIVPQLLNTISEEEVDERLRDPAWVLQEKHDGHRRLARRATDETIGINRKGLVTGLPQTVLDGLTVIDSAGTLVTDGELMGDVLALFDVLEHNGVDLRGQPYSKRLTVLATIDAQLKAVGKPGMYVTYTAYTEAEKRALYARLKADSCEGGVFKRLDAAYVAGRPNSGGNQVKRKFTYGASFVVSSQHKTKRSIGLSLLDANGAVIGVGNCTVPSNYAIPPVGAVVEVEYLYAFLGGSVFQPQYRGVRDDIDAEECLQSQLHYKASSDTVDEDEEA